MGKVAAVLALLLLAACSPEAQRRKLKDPACSAYVAVPGEPCRGHRFLYSSEDIPVCLCETVR